MHESSPHEPGTTLLRPFAQLDAQTATPLSPLRQAIVFAHRRNEQDAVRGLLAQANAFSETPDLGQIGAENVRIGTLARRLVHNIRQSRARALGVNALMQEFSLSSEEGVALMCVAEALLRIPDPDNADRLIADKLGHGDWASHLGESPSLFVNAAAWGLLITGKLITPSNASGLRAAFRRLLAKGGEPFIRAGVEQAMRLLGRQFVAGETIADALENSLDATRKGYRYSYDMLGEAALTAHDADRYCQAYEEAIDAIGQAAGQGNIDERAGISIKLSALHPRYVRSQRQRVMQELLPRVRDLMLQARRYGIAVNIDAEESERLDLSLDVLEALALDPLLADYCGIGFVVQAYQKRSPFVIDYLVDLARRSGRRLLVRLVKGAYWDSEIKRAQVDGMSDYPVYTRKAHTDVCYLVCAQKLLAAGKLLYPQFATHNAHTVAAIRTWADRANIRDYEFQCLHGMGESLYDQVVRPPRAGGLGLPCRIYAPVGSHRTLLAYLVRRLLENGANSSFVHQLVKDQTDIDTLVADPFEAARQSQGSPHPEIPLPSMLFGDTRRNSAGIDLQDEGVLRELSTALQTLGQRRWMAAPAPLVFESGPLEVLPSANVVLNPADHRDLVGHVVDATAATLERALVAARHASTVWQAVPVATRAEYLRGAADLFESHRIELMALAVREAGKSLPNAAAEVREAVDFLRYYAHQASLPSAQGRALGVVACISPWNFPLAIFAGQIGAALATGNAVLAKPAEQTPLIAQRAVQLLHAAGIPEAMLQLLPGKGEVVGAAILADPRVDGVLFTGSHQVALSISRTLARRMVAESREVVLVAETGGQNAMIVDSSALPEQVVQDAIASAFDSAGQRCSALRILCLQEEVAEPIIAMLHGALREQRVGKPDRLATDIGPVIDAEAALQLSAHIGRLAGQSLGAFQLPLSAPLDVGHFVAPTVIEVGSLQELQAEVFGPVLHVLRYRRDALAELIDEINATGYGLTLGIHSRIDQTIDFIVARAHVGNVYVNRNMIGATVGVQPFGGEGKSGTGPKAGGPLYLKRLQKDAGNEAGEPNTGPSMAVLDPALDAIQCWARVEGLQPLASLIQHYIETTLCGKKWLLPGPTGEQNTLSFLPRGAVFCRASSAAELLNQIAAALACGNSPLITQEAAALLPAGLTKTLLTTIEIWPERTCVKRARAILTSSAALASTVSMLATQNGTLMPIVVTKPMAPIALWRLIIERSVSINTAAAGGNASLMSLPA